MSLSRSSHQTKCAGRLRRSFELLIDSVGLIEDFSSERVEMHESDGRVEPEILSFEKTVRLQSLAEDSFGAEKSRSTLGTKRRRLAQ